MPKIVVHYTRPDTLEIPVEQSIFDFIKEREQTQHFDSLWEAITDNLIEKCQRQVDNVTTICIEDEDEQILLIEF